MYALTLVTMRRLGVPWLLAAGGVLLIALGIYLRPSLRPEHFGYVVLAAQLCLLSRMLREAPEAPKIHLRVAVALVLLQCVFINLHSYWLLGLALSGAVLVDLLLRWAWAWKLQPDRRRAFQTAVIRMAIVLAAQLLICLVNPWTWRLVALPFQTLWYLRVHEINAGKGEHPWSRIIEVRNLLSIQDFPGGLRDWALIAMLALAGAGGLLAALRRRWSWVLILLGMALVGSSMMRNTPPGAIAIAPLGLAGVCAGAGFLWLMLRARFRAGIILPVALFIIALGGWWTYRVVTQRFYVDRRITIRFGLGVSRDYLPIGPAEWISENLPEQRIWCDFTSSSTLHWATHPHKPVPILNNTWAYPPKLMGDQRLVMQWQANRFLLQNQQARQREEFLKNFYRRFQAKVVVVRADWARPLFINLVLSPRWEMMHVEGLFVVFARDIWPISEFVRENAIRPGKLDVDAHRRRAVEVDAAPSVMLWHEALILQMAYSARGKWGGFDDVHSRLPMLDDIQGLLEAAREIGPQTAEVWNQLGVTRMERVYVFRSVDAPPERIRRELDAARECFEKALELDPDFKPARDHLLRMSSGA
jgi:hypothetical protein